MPDARENSLWIRGLAMGMHVSVAATTPVDLNRSDCLVSPAEREGMDWAVCIGIRLSPSVLEGVEDRPTLLYKWHYQQANIHLDRTAFLLAQHILQRGFRALPVPASQMVDWAAERGHLSHRAVAALAGLGWRGRNNLLVHPEFGSRLRLATVLTDMPLEGPAAPSENRCGACRRCVEACPSQALGDTWQAYRLDACLGLLNRFSKERGIGVRICGICVKACSGKGIGRAA